MEAMQLSGQDMATWARPILLREAEVVIAAETARKSRKN